MLTPEIEREIAVVKSRIAFLGRHAENFDGIELLRRLTLDDRITIYTLLHIVSEHSLIDVSTNEMSLEEIFVEHFSNSPVVSELSVANGTNVRLRAGESVICLGEQEYVAMKLTEDDFVTYRKSESCLQLLKEVNGLLATRILVTKPAS